MSNILINAYSLKVGGGKYIIENLIRTLSQNNEKSNTYYLLLPLEISIVALPENIVIIPISKFLYHKLLSGIYHFFYIHRIIKNKKIDVIWNFGDVIIPNFHKQIYFFDWAYAVYDDDYIWEHMPLKQRITRKLKVRNIENQIRQVSTVISQTKVINNRLRTKFNIENVKTFATPVSFIHDKSAQDFMDSDKKKFLYVSSYTRHKNHEILLEISTKIIREKLPFEIYITIDKDEAKDFIDKIAEARVGSVLKNLGKLTHKEVGAALNSCDAVLSPTLLESYGLPFFEAMYFSKPIFTSDLDFSHDACGAAAIYFDPFNADSIVSAMKKVEDKNRVIEMQQEALHKLSLIPSWEALVNFFHHETECIK